MNGLLKNLTNLFTSQFPIVQPELMNEPVIVKDPLILLSTDERAINALGNVRNLQILELGSDDSVLLDKLHTQGANVYSVDKDKELYQKLKRKPYKENIHQGSFFDVPAIFPNKKFDVVILKSVIRELYENESNWETVQRFLELASSFLYKGGLLVISDGVQPSNSSAQVIVELSPEWNSIAVHYFNEQPFGTAYDMEQIAHKRWLGSYRALSAMMHSLNLNSENPSLNSKNSCPLPILDKFHEVLVTTGFEIISESYFSNEFLDRIRLHENMIVRTVEGSLLSPPNKEVLLIAESLN